VRVLGDLVVCVVGGGVIGGGVVGLAEVVRVVRWVQRLLLLVLPDVLDGVVEGAVGEVVKLLLRVLPDGLDVCVVRAVNQIVQDGIYDQAGLQCHFRFDRMDDGKWCAGSWRSGCRSALEVERHAACLYDEGCRMSERRAVE
jgi:hypothetical protein